MNQARILGGWNRLAFGLDRRSDARTVDAGIRWRGDTRGARSTRARCCTGNVADSRLRQSRRGHRRDDAGRQAPDAHLGRDCRVRAGTHPGTRAGGVAARQGARTATRSKTKARSADGRVPETRFRARASGSERWCGSGDSTGSLWCRAEWCAVVWFCSETRASHGRIVLLRVVSSSDVR